MMDVTAAELDREAMRRVARAARVEIGARADQGLFVAGPEDSIRALVQIVRSFLSEAERDERLIDVLLQDVEPGVMGSEHMLQLRMQAEARAAFLKDVTLLGSAAVGELLGSRARNTSAMASRLKREGRLFAITYRGVDLYPAAQIQDGEPSPAVPEVTKAFSGNSPWAVALWLNAPSGWLDGKKPIHLLATEPARVARAARQTTKPVRT